jgi:hypothetical protein
LRNALVARTAMNAEMIIKPASLFMGTSGVCLVRTDVPVTDVNLDLR